MKIFVELVFGITVGNLLTFTWGVIIPVVELTSSELQTVNKNAHQYVADIKQRPVEEAIGLAHIMLIDPRFAKFLPIEGKSELVLQISYGNNGRTGLFALYFLQVLLEKLGYLKYTRVVIFICRERNVNGLSEEDLQKMITEFESILNALKKLFPTGQFIVIHQGYGKTELKTVLEHIRFEKTRANWDCKMGSGRAGEDISENLFLSMMLDFYLDFLGIPLFANDIRSGLGAANAAEWLSPTSGLISVARVHPEQFPQGLVITQRIEQSLIDLQISTPQPPGPSSTKQYFKRIPKSGDIITVACVTSPVTLDFKELTGTWVEYGLGMYLRGILKNIRVQLFNFVNGESSHMISAIQQAISSSLSSL